MTDKRPVTDCFFESPVSMAVCHIEDQGTYVMSLQRSLARNGFDSPLPACPFKGVTVSNIYVTHVSTATPNTSVLTSTFSYSDDMLP